MLLPMRKNRKTLFLVNNSLHYILVGVDDSDNCFVVGVKNTHLPPTNNIHPFTIHLMLRSLQKEISNITSPFNTKFVPNLDIQLLNVDIIWIAHIFPTITLSYTLEIQVKLQNGGSRFFFTSHRVKNNSQILQAELYTGHQYVEIGNGELLPIQQTTQVCILHLTNIYSLILFSMCLISLII